MRLLLTGASGYLGSEIARQAGLGEVRRVEILDAEAVREAAAGCDAVIHTAYRQDDAEVIVRGSEHVARAAAQADARLVHLSTDLVFAGAPGRPLREDDPVAPLSPYGEAKAQAERRVAAAAPGAALVRTSLIYGGPRPSPDERRALDPPAGMTFYDDEVRCPVAVADLAAACLELAARPDVAGPLHVAGADAVTRLEFARLIAARAGQTRRRWRTDRGRPGAPATSRWTARAPRACWARGCAACARCSASPGWGAPRRR